MTKDNKGSTLIEVLIAAAFLASATLMVVDSMTTQRFLSTRNHTRAEATDILNRTQLAFGGGCQLPTRHEGRFESGQPFVLEVTEDVSAMAPLEKLSATISWEDLTTKKNYKIQNTSVRIR